jgi:hypothetical protein
MEVIFHFRLGGRSAMAGGLKTVGGGMAGEVKPGDDASGLVRRSWVRTSKRGGELTAATLEGEAVTARFLDERGGLHQVAGVVGRDAAGGLVVASWAEGVGKETKVPRDASVDVKARGR